jgi:hypothetical protein
MLLYEKGITMKVVINACYGGWGLSTRAVQRYAELKGIHLRVRTKTAYSEYQREDGTLFSEYSIERDDPFLVQVVEELGHEANGFAAELKIVEIPDGVQYIIDDYDGMETIREVHRTWR